MKTILGLKILIDSKVLLYFNLQSRYNFAEYLEK